MAAVTGLVLLGVAAALCIARLLRRGSIADKIVALDMLLVLVVTGIALGALLTGSGAFLDVLVVTSLLGFIGTVTVARFIERRGAQ